MDLIKNKKTYNEFTDDEKTKYLDFEQNFGKKQQFYEIEMQLLVLNRLETMPKVTPESNDDDV